MKAVSLTVSEALIIRQIMEAIIMGNNYHEQRNLFTDDELIACYLKYKSQIKAAEVLDVSRETVARAVRRSGIKLSGRDYNGRNQPQSKISDEDLIKESSKINCREIAVKYDMSEERVYLRAKKLGLKIDSKGSGGHWKRRALRYGCTEFDETITLKALIARDKGFCRICGEPIDKNDITNGHVGRKYPSLDHIIPLSKGGTHTWSNVQLAHMACNAGKCDKVNGGKI